MDESPEPNQAASFFEALPATQRRLTDGDVAVRAEALSEMLRARMLTEMQRGIFYVSADYERSYDARDKKMGRHEDEADVLTEWRGFVQQAEMADASIRLAGSNNEPAGPAVCRPCGIFWLPERLQKNPSPSCRG